MVFDRVWWRRRSQASQLIASQRERTEKEKMGLWSRASKFAACGVLAVSVPAIGVAQNGQQTALRDTQSAGAAAPSIVETASAELPDSPGAVAAQTQNSQQPAPGASSQVPAPPQSQAVSAQETQPQRPVGTAAAPAPAVSGVTAAQPSGVAMAPAKQHRARTIIIRVGAVVGAGVAIGSVAALTAGTSSKPPGAH